MKVINRSGEKKRGRAGGRTKKKKRIGGGWLAPEAGEGRRGKSTIGVIEEEGNLQTYAPSISDAPCHHHPFSLGLLYSETKEEEKRAYSRLARFAEVFSPISFWCVCSGVPNKTPLGGLVNGLSRYLKEEKKEEGAG